MPTRVSGGDRLTQRLKEIAEALGHNPEVKVGFPENSTYPDGTSLPMVAAINEFGSPRKNIPARPFMRATVWRHSAEWPALAGRLLVRNNYDVHKALSLMGEVIKGQMQQSITSGPWQKNAPSTIAAKGFDRPLISTGFLRRSITVEVKA